MAQRRMFSKKVIETDEFLSMPQSTQLLYFHLALQADDDGFVANPKSIMRKIGCGDDDLKVLIGKRFVIAFDRGICVIRHWLLHNYIPPDRYEQTQYLTEKSTLVVSNGEYRDSKEQPDVPLLPTEKSVKVYQSMSYLSTLPQEDLDEFIDRFGVTAEKIKSKAEDLMLYCQRRGKVYRNYRAFLLNALKKDFADKGQNEKYAHRVNKA